MKILFYENNPSRETPMVSFIKDELRKKNDTLEFYEMPFRTDKESFGSILRLAPDIIFTFPITLQIQTVQYTLLKYLLDAKIITFATEGLFDFDDEDLQRNVAGYYDYSCQLIDYECYWGSKAAEVCGNLRLEKKRLRTRERIKVFGYPLYEKEKVKLYYKDYDIVNSVVDISKKAKKNILIVTGFQGADFTEEQIIGVGDYVPAEQESVEFHERLEKMKETFKQVRNLRNEYVNLINRLAKELPDFHFWVKLHPSEIRNIEENDVPYDYFKELQASNISILAENIPIGAIMDVMDCMIHYGSTTSLEAYIYKIPTIYLFYGQKSKFHESISTVDIEVRDYEKVLQFVLSEMCFRENEKASKLLYDGMNYIEGKSYKPTECIAEFINEIIDEKNLRIKSSDVFLKRILKTCYEGKVRSGSLLAKTKSDLSKCYLYRIEIVKELLKSVISLQLNSTKHLFGYFIRIYRNPFYFVRDIFFAILSRK